MTTESDEYTSDGEPIDPDEVYVMMLGLLQAQGSKFVEPMLREHHQSRGKRLFTMMTLGIVLPGFDQALAHCHDVARYFERQEQLRDISFLVHRSRADFEVAMEGLLTGRQALVSDAMRDVMEIELLLRDFAIRPTHIQTWLHADEKTMRNKFAPREVRRRLANDLYPGKGFDLPDTDEYMVHSEVLHPSPFHAHRDKSRDPAMHDRQLLFESGEPLEHAHRLFGAIDMLIEATEKRTSRERPPRHDELRLLKNARQRWIEFGQQIKDQIGMPPRGPRPRKERNPLLKKRSTEPPRTGLDNSSPSTG